MCVYRVYLLLIYINTYTYIMYTENIYMYIIYIIYKYI